MCWHCRVAPSDLTFFIYTHDIPPCVQLHFVGFVALLKIYLFYFPLESRITVLDPSDLTCKNDKKAEVICGMNLMLGKPISYRSWIVIQISPCCSLSKSKKGTAMT